MFDCTITVSEAEAYSGIPIRKWFSWIEKGLVVSSPGPPNHLNCAEQATIAPLYRIPISTLPRPAAMRFIQERILHESFFSVDFIGYLNRQGDAAFAELLKTICETKPLVPFIPYPDFQAATGQLEMTAQFHKMCQVIGHPGAGKIRLLLEFAHAHDNAHYICPARPCRIKDLLRLLGEPMGYYVPNATSQQVIRDLIHFLNHRGCDTIFLIDECDTLCPKGGHINNIDKLDVLRYIWDHTRLHTAFIFAAPYDLEVRLQKSSEQISNSQFYRRCGIYQLQGMPKAAIQKFLSQIEQEFHVKFDFTAADELTKRIAAADRGGLGISIEIISNCLMAVRTQWQEYYRMIEADVPRDTALHLFDQAETCAISLPLLRKAMELMR